MTLEEDDVISQSGSESEGDVEVGNKKKKTDEGLNSDFDFDAYGVLNGVKDIDETVWGFSGIKGTTERAGVDLEGIIARRRENLDADGGKSESEQVSDDESEELDEDREFNGFDDDIGNTRDEDFSLA